MAVAIGIDRELVLDARRTVYTGAEIGVRPERDTPDNKGEGCLRGPTGLKANISRPSNDVVEDVVIYDPDLECPAPAIDNRALWHERHVD